MAELLITIAFVLHDSLIKKQQQT